VGDADARLLAGQREGRRRLAFNMGEECAAVDGFFDVDELGLRKNWVSVAGTNAFFLRAKAQVHSLAFSARLKSCPSHGRIRAEFFRRPSRLVPAHGLWFPWAHCWLM